MNFHLQLILTEIFFIYDTFMFITSSQHVVGITLNGNMYNKKFQNENSDEHEIIGEKLSENHNDNENIISRGIQQ